MKESTKPAGNFRGLSIERELLHRIPFSQPTPVQRRVLPLLLEGRSLMSIARTGSGKTLCYMIPAVQKAIEGKNSLILLPTKELVFQVKRIFKRLTQRVTLKGTVEITTLKELEISGIAFLVVDEIDRILEEKSLREHFMKIIEEYNGQKAYFSATLPDEPLNINIVQLENKIPDTITHTFLYVPREYKESALLDILDANKKTIIFTATRYGVDFVLAILNKVGYQACGIYSSMDDDARAENFKRFLNGRINILVVTDIAARGLDIPFLDASISYDLCDEKTFVHRVGRVRGVGSQVSLVTYSDVFHFFNIKETHLPDVEIGTVPHEVLVKYDFRDLDGLRFTAERGYQRCLDFRRKVSVPSEFKSLIGHFGVHSRYNQGETLAGQLKQMRAGKPVEVEKKEEVSYKDQFYIPYARKEKKTHLSAFSVAKDDYIKERKEKQYRRRIYRKGAPNTTL